MVRPIVRTATLVTSALVTLGLLGIPATVAQAAAPLPPPVATPAVPATSPDQAAPPPPVDASEQPAPGQTAPPPLPEPARPAGGPRMAECGYVLPPGAPPLPRDLGFESWVLQDLDTGAVLAARDPHARQRPASLIKLLLAQVVARGLDPNKVITGTQDDANQEGTRVGIGPGGQYTVGQLVHALLMASGNDVAHALAMAMGGVPTTLARMNAVAAQLGAQDTRAASPSGLDAPGMCTSAYDLSLVFKADLATPLVADAVRTVQLPLPGYGTKPGFMVNNDNWLLRTYPGDLGGKTGYTDDAQQTYANAAEQNGHRVALVMTRGTNHLAGRWQNARELMDYGFALENAHTPPVGQIVAPRAVTGSATPSANNLARQVPAAAGHPNTQVVNGPDGSLNAFGSVGLPLTLLAVLALGLIAMLYLRRQKRRRARAAAAARAASAVTVRTPFLNLGQSTKPPGRLPANGYAGEATKPVKPLNGMTTGRSRSTASNGVSNGVSNGGVSNGGASGTTRAMPAGRPAPRVPRQQPQSWPPVPQQMSPRPAAPPRPAPEWPSTPEWPE